VVQFALYQATKAQRVSRGIATPPPASPLGKRHGTHCIGGWVGPTAALDMCNLAPTEIRSADRPVHIYQNLIRLIASSFPSGEMHLWMFWYRTSMFLTIRFLDVLKLVTVTSTPLLSCKLAFQLKVPSLPNSLLIPEMTRYDINYQPRRCRFQINIIISPHLPTPRRQDNESREIPYT
jgi:hypothetical protein